MTAAPDTLYEKDFCAWTQPQADLPRRLPAAGNELGLENIAEEIESLGKSDLRAAQSLVEHIVEYLLMRRLPRACPYTLEQIISGDGENWFHAPGEPGS